jgi:biopolymer transport protein ExbB/TolQ
MWGDALETRRASMAILAEGGSISDFVALVTAIAGMIAAILSLLKYLDERRKRKTAEKKLHDIFFQVQQLKDIQETGQDQCVGRERDEANQKLDDILAQLEDGGPKRNTDG